MKTHASRGRFPSFGGGFSTLPRRHSCRRLPVAALSTLFSPVLSTVYTARSETRACSPVIVRCEGKPYPQNQNPPPGPSVGQPERDSARSWPATRVTACPGPEIGVVPHPPRNWVRSVKPPASQSAPPTPFFSSSLQPDLGSFCEPQAIYYQPSSPQIGFVPYSLSNLLLSSGLLSPKLGSFRQFPQTGPHPPRPRVLTSKDPFT
jgi:hypothetical protein